MDDGYGTVTYKRPLHTSEAAAWLGISEHALLRLARAGAVPAKKIGKRWYFDQDKLAAAAGVGPSDGE